MHFKSFKKFAALFVVLGLTVTGITTMGYSRDAFLGKNSEPANLQTYDIAEKSTKDAPSRIPLNVNIETFDAASTVDTPDAIFTADTSVPSCTYDHAVKTEAVKKAELATQDKPDRDVDDRFSGIKSVYDIPYFSPWQTIAYVTCDAVGINHVPITYGWSQDICDSVDICMANFTGARFGENLISIICGHNYKVLSTLHNAKVGDDIIIETVYGANFHYRITKSCKALLQEGESFYGFTDMDGNWIMRAWEETKDLTVFTCFDMNDDDYRWVVRAEFVEGTDIRYQ